MLDRDSSAWADALANEVRGRYPGVRLELGVDRGPFLVLFWVLLPETERGNGVGTRVMADITAAADLRGVPVTLSPSARFGGDLDRLQGFYERLGFITNTSRGQMGAARESMVRVPRTRTAFDERTLTWQTWLPS